MHRGESGQKATPSSVTAAFMLQIVVTGLLVVLALVYVGDRLATGDRWATTGEQPPDPLDSAALLLALAVWLGAAAFGLQGGHRGAYASLAGGAMAFLLAAVTVVLLLTGPSRRFFTGTAAAPAP